MVSKVFMDRRLREDGTEQGSANVFLCGLPPFKYPPNKQGQEPEIPSIDFPGLNTTLLYVAPPGKIEEVRSPFGNNNLVNLCFFSGKKHNEKNDRLHHTALPKIENHDQASDIRRYSWPNIQEQHSDR